MTNTNKKDKKSPKIRAEKSWGREEDWQFIADKLKHIEASSIEEFYINNGLPKTTFYDAVRKYPIMSDALSIAHEKLGIRNEKLCLERNLGMSTVAARLLPQYLDRWKKDVEWHNKLKEEPQATDKKYTTVDSILLKLKD